MGQAWAWMNVGAVKPWRVNCSSTSSRWWQHKH
jgi:hypothetical protein